VSGTEQLDALAQVHELLARPDGAFGDDVAELRGMRARVISLPALRADNSEVRDDPRVAAKDPADTATLSHRPAGESG